MRVLIATAQSVFLRGGAEAHAEGLRRALQAAGHSAEILRIPLTQAPPERILDHMLACRLLDVTESTGTAVDLLIGLKFPAYLIPHANKKLWIIHQYRFAYELWDHPVMGELSRFPNGVQVRSAIHLADRAHIPQARAVFANSLTVARRLQAHCGIPATSLYHPPPDPERFFCAPAQEYLFAPSRLVPLKRQWLVLHALQHTAEPVRVRFAGGADRPEYADELRTLANRLRVRERVEWLGHVSQDDKRQLYAGALGVVYPPEDEDYGYVTLEAMLSAKPVITCTDSGGPLEFVIPGETGLVSEPTARALAAAFDDLWRHRDRARRWGEAGRERYEQMRISWTKVVETLLA